MKQALQSTSKNDELNRNKFFLEIIRYIKHLIYQSENATKNNFCTFVHINEFLVQLLLLQKCFISFDIV